MIRLDEERDIVTFGGGRFFALGLIQTLFVVKYPLLTHVKPGVKLHTKAYMGAGVGGKHLLSLYIILPCTMHNIWHTNGGSEGVPKLRNCIAIALQPCGQCRWGG